MCNICADLRQQMDMADDHLPSFLSALQEMPSLYHRQRAFFFKYEVR